MQPFIVKLNGLASGRTVFDWKADGEFFEQFGNKDILAADVDVTAQVVNHGVTVDVQCSMEGTVTVLCDRCLDELERPVEAEFSESYTPESACLDLSQDIYDYVCIALPLQRVHPDGQCNPETIKFLSK